MLRYRPERGLTARARSAMTLSAMTAALVIYSLAPMVSIFSATELAPGWTLPSDSKAEQGEIIAPRICPADEDWISWEVHDRSQVRLFVYNRVTNRKAELTPPPESSALSQYSTGVSSSRDLAWCPIKVRGKVWALFVGEADGQSYLYLYDLQASEYHRIEMLQDSLGNATKRDPAWSPDGKGLAYTIYLSGNADIYVLPKMDAVLKNPKDPNIATQHLAAVVGPGDQFGPVWSPVAGLSFFLYNDIDENRTAGRVRGCDLFLKRTAIELSDNDPTMTTLAPSWSPAGDQVAFYQYSSKMVKTDKTGRPEIGDKIGLSLASFRLIGDSALLSQRRGGRAFTSLTLADVAPNRELYLGPTWPTNGREILAPLYNEKDKNPARVVSIGEWEGGARSSEFLYSKFGGDQFAFPLDFSITGKSLAFTYAQGQQRNLVFGRLAPDTTTGVDTSLALLIAATPSRLSFWQNYTQASGKPLALTKTTPKQTRPKPVRKPKPEGEEGGGNIFAAVGNFLFAPIGGTELVVNRPIVPIAAGVALLVIGGGEDEKKIPRNFDPPVLPTSGTGNTKIFQLRFSL